jgi:flagellar FliJ protein
VRFLFRLERILQLRASKEKERARELGGALREEEEKRRKLEEAAAHLGRCGEQIVDAASKPTTAGALRNMNLAVNAAAGEVEAAEDSHRQAEARVDTEREKFSEARTERRVVERLRERRREAWSVEVSRSEQSEHDEAVRQRRDGTGKGE